MRLIAYWIGVGVLLVGATKTIWEIVDHAISEALDNAFQGG